MFGGEGHDKLMAGDGISDYGVLIGNSGDDTIHGHDNSDLEIEWIFGDSANNDLFKFEDHDENWR